MRSVAPSSGSTGSLTIDEVLHAGLVRAVFQPVIHLPTGAIVGYESLARGPGGSAMELPTDLFAAARDAGLLEQLDWACRAAAVRGALAAGMDHRLALFVNVEPELLMTPVPPGLGELMSAARRRLNIVLELTERALTKRPAQLLDGVARVRAIGCAVALDDVGVDAGSLALMPFVEPELVKLDLAVVQGPPSAELATTLAATRAEVARSGVRLLAEGIETEAHRRRAVALGAEYGQGWLLGAPAGLPEVLPRSRVRLGGVQRATFGAPGATPFEIVAARSQTERMTVPAYGALRRELEDRARAQGRTAVVLATYARAAAWDADERRRYAALARATAFTGVLGGGFAPAPAAGVRTTALDAGEPLAQESGLVAVAPHFAAALVVRARGDEEGLEVAFSEDRRLAVRAATALLARVAPAA